MIRPGALGIREQILSLIRLSNIIAKVYTELVLLYCSIVVIRKNCYEALSLLCDAQRRVPNLNITNKCAQLGENIIQNNCCKDGALYPIEENYLLKAFYKSSVFCKSEQIFVNESESDRLHLRHYRVNSDPSRQGNMILLKKPNKASDEKGVIVLKFTPTFEQFPAIFNLTSILKEYRIVFEPSSYRNIESSLFLYSGLGLTHILQAAHIDDKIVLDKHTSSIKTIDLGSGDWIDSNIFSFECLEKVYDVVMVASWLKLKRHEVLFNSLRELKKRGRSLRVALIGYPMDMKKEDIINKARKYGVDSLCDIYDQIPSADVAKIVSSSKVAVHLSIAEGTNKASYEALLCNVPLIVYKYNIGFRNNYINENTGVLADDNELPDAIEYVLAHQHSFSPRKWILKHSGYIYATHKLNQALKEIAHEKGESWFVDIVPKKNGPNFLYANENDRIDMEPAYFDLRKHLLH